MSTDNIENTTQNENEEDENFKSEPITEADDLNENNNKEEVNETKALLENANLEETKPKPKSTKIDTEVKMKHTNERMGSDQNLIKLTKCQKRLRYIYDKKTGKVFGRTGKSWGLLLVFFLSFYLVLAALFMTMMYGFLNCFIAVSQPYRTGAQSILEFLPGLNIQPRLSLESALIFGSINATSESHKNYLSSVDKFFQKSFNESINIGVAINCLDSDVLQNVSQFCRFDKTLLGPCANPENELRLGRLCFFVRINKIFGWVPSIENKLVSNDTFVDCEGLNPGDQNNLGKPVYYPRYVFNDTKSCGLISNKYFPFVNQRNYMSPMVAVQFPQMAKNIAILVQCTMHNLQKVSKSVKFEIMLLSK